MPIRTNRGRVAVYRRLWGWPLRSPRHLVGAVVVLIVLIVGLGIALPKLLPAGGSGGDANAEPGADVSSTARPSGPGAAPSSPLPTRLTSPRESPTPAAASPDALHVAGQWAGAWVNHPDGARPEQWLEGLRPYTTEEYLPVMESVDPANITATKVTGEPTAGTSYTSSVEAIVPTDGPKLSITVIRTSAGWRVSQYEQAD